MENRQGMASVLLGLALLIGSCGPNRYELYQRLPEGDKELFARSKQFMTDRQQGRFLTLPDSDKRVEFIESLHLHDRLAGFPPYIREAILSQRVVPGMDTQAVLLAWGRPLSIDRRNMDGVQGARWLYERPGPDGSIREIKVYFLAGQVTEVSPPPI